MDINANVLVRPFVAGDRAVVRQIACDTALVGESCRRFFDGEEIFADALTGYFTDCEPQSCFVAAVNGQVVGYIIGALDTRKMEKVFQRKLFWPLLGKALRQGAFFRRKNLALLAMAFRSFCRREFAAPVFYGDYPATLHINIKEGFRAYGLGARLISGYLQYLRAQQVRGVAMATMSDRARIFFERQGFRVLFKGKRSYLRHVLHRDLDLYILGRKI